MSVLVRIHVLVGHCVRWEVRVRIASVLLVLRDMLRLRLRRRRAPARRMHDSAVHDRGLHKESNPEILGTGTRRRELRSHLHFMEHSAPSQGYRFAKARRAHRRWPASHNSRIANGRTRRPDLERRRHLVHDSTGDATSRTIIRCRRSLPERHSTAALAATARRTTRSHPKTNKTERCKHTGLGQNSARRSAFYS